MTWLALSTSSALQTVALWPSSQAEPFIRERRFRRRQPRELLSDLQALCDEAETSLRDVTRLYVDIGPGTFTGLRAGLATARALGYAGSATTLMGVSSHQLIRAQFPDDSRPMLICTPSRAGFVYGSRWSEVDAHTGLCAMVSEVEEVSVEAVCAGAADLVVAPAAWLQVHTLGAREVLACEEPHARHADSPLIPWVPTGWAEVKPLYVGVSDAERHLGVHLDTEPLEAAQRSHAPR